MRIDHDCRRSTGWRPSCANALRPAERILCLIAILICLFPAALRAQFARAVELALKASLLASRDNHGVVTTVKELRRRKYGHRLNRLLAKGKRRGLFTRVPLTAEHCDEILSAHEYYTGKVFEYPDLYEALKSYPRKPNPNALREAAELLVKHLESVCLASTRI